MGKPIYITLDEKVYEGLVTYLEQEFGSTRTKNLIVNLAVREFLQRKRMLTNPRDAFKGKPGQGSLFKE